MMAWKGPMLSLHDGALEWPSLWRLQQTCTVHVLVMQPSPINLHPPCIPDRLICLQPSVQCNSCDGYLVTVCPCRLLTAGA